MNIKNIWVATTLVWVWWFPRIQGDPPPLQLIPQRDRESDLLQRSIVQSLQHMLFNPGDSWTVWKLVLTLDTIFTKNITKLQVGNILQHGSGVIYTVYIHIKIYMDCEHVFFYIYITDIWYQTQLSWTCFHPSSVLFYFLLQLAKAWWSLLTKMVPF